MSPLFVIGFCGLMLALNAFSCDITLPAFSAMSTALAAPMEQVQAIIGVFLLSAAFGQIVFGPASDRFGRRPLILTGLAIYMLGAALGALASSIELLLAGRGLQGLGSACCVVVARAILRDTNEGSDLARAMAMAMAIISFGPIFAPLLGFGLLTFGGWRGVFAGMGIFGLLMLTVGVLRLRESNPSIDPEALSAGKLLDALRRIVLDRQSRHFLALSGLNQFMILWFVANAPRLYEETFGVGGLAFTVLFGINGVAIIVGQMINARTIGRFGVLVTTRTASLVILAMTLAIAALAWLGMLALWGFVLLMFAFSGAFPAVMSNTASLVIEPHRQIAGFASSAYGFVSQLVASSLLLVAVPFVRGALVPWALGLALAATMVASGLALYRHR